jgi:hypothetical protein
MSTLDPEITRLRSAFSSLAEDAAAGPACPHPERIWSALKGEAESPAADLRELVLHTAECPSCAESWRLAGELLAAEADVRPRAVGRARWRGGALPLAAAVAAVALAGVVLLRDGRGTVEPGYRDPAGGVLRTRVSEERPLPRAACVLRWSSVAQGARYDLRVATSTLAAVYRARGLSVTEHQVPADALAGLPSGSRLIWQVEAVAPDGTRTTSPAFVVRIQ